MEYLFYSFKADLQLNKINNILLVLKQITSKKPPGLNF
jgi:hypothetical protein